MVESLPSRRVGIADVPETSDFDAKFIYNFFTSDEKINENGTVPAKYLEYTAEAFNRKIIDTVDFDRNVPRYVELNWKPVVVTNGVRRNYVPKIKDNLENIYFEDDFTYHDFTTITAQDTNPQDSFAFLVKKALESSVFKNKHNNKRKSQQDLLKDLNKNTPEDVDPKFLEIGFDMRGLGVKFFDKSGNELKNELVEKLKKTKMHVQLNNKIIHDVISNATLNDVTTPFSDEYSSLLPSLRQVQETAIQTKGSAIPSLLDFDFEIDKPVFKYRLDSDGFESTLQTVGYLIEKQEITSTGTSFDKNPIVVQGETVGTTFDVRIRYGSNYCYKIRTVSYIEIQGIEENYGIVAGVGFFVASKPSNTVLVSCTEEIAPPHPADFNARWDYKKNIMCLEWNFPIETQRDVKKFQVFRRETITDPFELLMQYDFDDSALPAIPNENPNPELVKKVENPVLFHHDPEFKKSSRFIYAVCSVDAHGFSSNYSMQYEITFDSQRNKLKKKLISVSGAPKQYPNIYLNRDTFVDSIKDEWHRKLTIAFNPEYLKVYNNQNNDLGLLKTGEKEKYVLQIINLDLQKQENIEIKLIDRTSSNIFRRPITNNNNSSNSQNRNLDIF
jgi:hypothetical protein